MFFWKTENQGEEVDANASNNDDKHLDQEGQNDDDDGHAAENDISTTPPHITLSQDAQLLATNNTNDDDTQQHQSTQQQQQPHIPTLLLPLSTTSPSKRALQIMNVTEGLCADPVHFHSFEPFGGSSNSGWMMALPTPKSLFVGTFHKCISCGERLGGRASVTTYNNDDEQDAPDTAGGGSSVAASSAAASPSSPSAPPTEISSSSSEGMLHCVACGAYAHRSCAFARPTTTPSGKIVMGNCTPLCEVNLKEIQLAFGLKREEIVPQKRQGSEKLIENTKNTATVKTVESRAGTDDITCGGVAESGQSNSSWSIFGRKSITNENNDSQINNSAMLEEKNDPTPTIEKPANQQFQPPQPGVISTSIRLLQKTSETATSIPRASALGIVAGGAAGLVIAGPAGAMVGCQIGRTALAVGAAVEGGLGVGVLAMSLAAAANYSTNFSSLSSTVGGGGGSSEKRENERELKLNANLVLVRPDIEVDPIWGVYANEAREQWEQKHNKDDPHKASACGSFGLGNIGNLFSKTKEEDDPRGMRYKKDSDIIKADASELPMKEKVFLLVNRILNDKTSLPGYQYRYLVLKHKRRTMFGDEDGVGIKDDMDMEDHPARSCRRDAHGVIKHVTATLLEVRPGLASSPSMTELSASAVEVLVFGELYEDCFKEIIHEVEEKDEALLAKVKELGRRRGSIGSGQNTTTTNGDEMQASSVSQSAIAALQSLPKAHTPTEKLLHCVQFLERVSEHFSSTFQGKVIDADTLLVLVCQHVVAANVQHLYAEVAFIEEFSRDEQLLSGKEGYALITLQASLFYLDELEELPDDLLPNVTVTVIEDNGDSSSEEN